MNTFLQPGVFADHTPAAAVTAGDIINNVGPGVGVADNDIAANEKGAVRCAGVYSVDNPDDTAFAYGATVGYDATNKKAVGAGTGDFDIGSAYAVYVAGELVVQVLINDLVG